MSRPIKWVNDYGRYQHNMSVYASVVDSKGRFIEAAGNTLAVFAPDGKCRRMTQIEDGPVGKWFQMTVVSNVVYEAGLVISLLDSATRESL